MLKWARLGLFVIVIALLGTLMLTTTPSVTSQVKLGLDLQGGFEILYQVEPLDQKQQVTPELLKAMEQMIDKRVNIGKVTEPEITIEGSNRIRVKLAGIKSEEKLREQLARPANLTFQDESGAVVLDGRELAPNGASVQYDELHRPYVALKFMDKEKVRRITETNLHKRMSIHLDEQTISAPEIQNVISDGNASIQGGFTVEKATEMAALLNAGALPAKLIEIQATSVGASLGESALTKTLEAGVVAAVFILLFMLIVYRLPGMIANITLAVFVYLCLVVFHWMNATLTLPGIAGFILAIGMAVDANIITYERIQEELKKGKTVLSAFRIGQRESFITIMDAHITTCIAGVVLLQVGTSAVQGFAVILIMTIIISLLTNVFGSRILLWLVIRSNLFNQQKWFGSRRALTRDWMPFDIVRIRKYFFAFSGIVMMAGLVTILTLGLNAGVDFKAGTRLDVFIGKEFQVSEVDRIIHKQVPDIAMKPVVKFGDHAFYATTTFDRPVDSNQLQAIEHQLQQAYGEQVSKQETTVNPMVANEMVTKAAIAILIATVCIVIYIAFRFQFYFGIACIIALLHDVLIPIALFSLLRLEIDLTFIAAILTIVGYSINDTIVIFDRIRTNNRLTKPVSIQELEEMVNTSLWQTMRRSIFTVVTVFISAAALFWLGGEGIRHFSLALIFGLVSGTYSSIFIAAQVWFVLKKRATKVQPLA
ncbi:protein translocase subunit SecD [Brevibacillus ginsengisoli]|uniref:protein translocase subunit SecD n=1 Tax=Brevibacillus ginsengisoli TaxID=363854 RepID=UPI003CF911E2